MIFTKKSFQNYNVNIEISQFGSTGNTAEFYAFFHLVPSGSESFASQLERVVSAKNELLRALGEEVKIVFERYFLSDIANQSFALLPYSPVGSCSRKSPLSPLPSLIQQQPLDGSKLALLVYFVKGAAVSVSRDGETTVVESNGYTHLWTTNLMTEEGDSYLQTHKILFHYEDLLKKHGATLADNCLRTWFFVRDVDSNYAGMVKGRKEHFDHIGLTPDTHYIASTGIDGSPAKGNAKVQFEAVSAKGLQAGQIKYLQALTHLNPTYEYGVTFERGTRVTYGDRSHIWISGTASIDNKGQIVHVGDVSLQTKRMWENVEALLKEGDATYDDVAYMIVYLRDIADYSTVKALYDERFPEKPKVFVHAPVCRPGWLIEMECVAVTSRGDASYNNF